MNEHKRRPRHLDLFSGIGGFSLAAEKHGFETIAFSEIDPFASAVLASRWPHVPNFGDVRTVTRDKVGHVDLVTGGFPCQPFSCAGKRRGTDDPRFLWDQCVRVLGEIRPRFALFENVANLLLIDKGRTFNRVVADCTGIGYDLLWNVVPAASVGAPHLRERIWIVAHSMQGAKMGNGCTNKDERCNRKRRHTDVVQTGNAEQQQNEQGPSEQDSIAHTAEARQQACILQARKLEGEPSHGTHSYPDCTAWQEVPEAEFCSMDDGVSKRLAALGFGAAGNAIVPQVAEIFIEPIYRLITINPTIKSMLP